MTTIRDVARRAGVSVTAASYALNNTGTIGETTRERVLKAAQELNYHPNAFARHLKNGKTLTIGVFITRFGGAFYEEILEGIHDAILKTDYELIVSPDCRAERKVLLHQQVDGGILFDSKISDETILKLAARKFPLVVLDRALDAEHLFPLLLDNASGVREAFRHLYRRGARDIAFVEGAQDAFDNREREQAFLDEAAGHGVAVRCYAGNFTELSGYDVAQALIADRDLPEAVFCANDQMAIGFLKAMKEHGLRAPDDVAVVGFDDIQVAKYMQPALTTIGASRFVWGSLAATHLIDFLERGARVQPARIPVTFIPRESA
jgi:LacI family transcriptional regulator